jgi:hypothetical protein
VGGVGDVGVGPSGTGLSGESSPPPQAARADSAVMAIVIFNILPGFMVVMVAPLVNADDLILCSPGQQEV